MCWQTSNKYYKEKMFNKYETRLNLKATTMFKINEWHDNIARCISVEQQRKIYLDIYFNRAIFINHCWRYERKAKYK